jgi:hypothetical protein
MQLRTVVVLSVITVVKPEQVVPRVIRAYSPGNRLIGIPAIMEEKTVQVSTTMSQVIKREKENPEFPVEEEADGNEIQS